MNLRYSVHDSFFRYPHIVRSELIARGFSDVLSPIDEIKYPGICNEVSPWIVAQLTAECSRLSGRSLTVNQCFARWTGETTAPAPNLVHSDRIMGDLTAIVYLSVHWPPLSGTSFWRHPTEGEFHTASTDTSRINGAMNDLSQWERLMLVPGAFNRLLLCDSRLWHCAEPVGGWGSSPGNGRLVLTAFFRTV